MQSYHPKRARNEILDEDEKTKLLYEGNHMTIAMCDNNNPYVVTLSYGFDEDNGRLYFHCAKKGDKLDFIGKNDMVCATIIKDNGYLDTKCDHDYATLVIRGRMKIADDLNEKKHGLKVLLSHLERDPAPILKRNIVDDSSYDNVVILRLDIESVVGKKYVG